MTTEQTPYTDLMIDLETLGLGPQAVVTSIGLLAFDVEDPTHEPAFDGGGIDIQWQLDDKRRIDKSTLLFRLGNPKLLQAELKGEMGFIQLWENLQAFLATNFPKSKPERVWANSPSFDLVILQSLLDPPLPWEFWREMDLRTLEKTHPYGREIRKQIAPTTAHDAEADCRNQAKLAQALWAALRRAHLPVKKLEA